VTCEEDASCPSQAPLCVSTSQASCSGGGAQYVCGPLNDVTPDADAGTSSRDSGVRTIEAPLVNVGTRPVPDVDDCDEAGWCWDSPHAPGERFTAFSRDGRLAVGEFGVVFETSGVYLERPSSATLQAVATLDDAVWVGGVGGLWQMAEDGWQQLSDVTVSDLAVSPVGELWGISRDRLMQMVGGDWNEIPLPRKSTDTLGLFDVEVLGNGDVWLLAGYWRGRVPEGTLFTFVHDAWQEYPAEGVTGSLQFLEGKDSLYAYTTASPDDTLRVFDPLGGWSVIGSETESFPGLLFWGPEEGLLWSNDEATAPILPSKSDAKTDVACEAAVRWDQNTVVCAPQRGGLVYLDVNADGELVTSDNGATFAPFDIASFGTLPAPVWAQTAEAWASDVGDVWRAPLEHFDGSTWTSHTREEDEFSAIAIDGTGRNDVWFAAVGELRHWDGEQVTTVDLPSSQDGFEIMAIRALSSNDVWVLRRTLVPVTSIELLHLSDGSWTNSFTSAVNDDFAVVSVAGVVHAAGAIVGTSDDLWAAFGQTLLHFDGSSWSVVLSLPSLDSNGSDPAGVLHAAWDDGDLWLLTEAFVYQWVDAELVVKGYRSGTMDHLALDDDFVWNFDGAFRRRLAR
jgi:hypothetical protein